MATIAALTSSRRSGRTLKRSTLPDSSPRWSTSIDVHDRDAPLTAASIASQTSRLGMNSASPAPVILSTGVAR